MKSQNRINQLHVITLFWVGLVIAGFWMVINYQVKPGAMAIPEENVVSFDDPNSSWHLIAFLHPECTCSRATLEELNILQKRLGNLVSIRIFISSPFSLDETKESEIYRLATRSHDWSVDIDLEAVLATQMLAYTSGICYLYSPNEELIFAGGITASRGHSGPAAGQEIISAAVRGDQQAIGQLKQYPVYGCGIQDKSHLVISKI